MRALVSQDTLQHEVGDWVGQGTALGVWPAIRREPALATSRGRRAPPARRLLGWPLRAGGLLSLRCNHHRGSRVGAVLEVGLGAYAGLGHTRPGRRDVRRYRLLR